MAGRAHRWSRLNRKLKRKIDGALVPHRADEYVLYQALAGTWPVDGLASIDRPTYAKRLQEYLLKVAREAARFTTWVNPNAEYEAALTGFVAGLFDARRSKAFQADFAAFIDSILDGGLTNALAQQAVKLTAPGVPDLYQGTEVWDDSLVDPDNRRPVDFRARERLLDRLPEEGAVRYGFLREPAAKLDLTMRLLALRHEVPSVFTEGDYQALAAEGPAAAHIVAFARRAPEATVIVAAPRLPVKLAKECGLAVGDATAWAATTIALPAGMSGLPARDVLRGGTIVLPGDGNLEATDLFAAGPVAVLHVDG